MSIRKITEDLEQRIREEMMSNHIRGCGCSVCAPYLTDNRWDPAFVRQFDNRLDKSESWAEWKDRQYPTIQLTHGAQAAEDEVNHPSYYGGDTPYEVLKVAIAWEEMFGLGFLVLMAIKYLTRNGRKPGQDGRKDLREAVFYIKAEFARRYPGEEL
jgi:hypothetical protein